MPDPFSRPDILLVEDDKLMAKLTAETLREEGHLVIEAYDAELALTLLKQHPAVEMLLSDINLPGRSGISLATEIEVQSRGLAVVLTSGRLVTDRDLPPGVMFLQKPFTAKQLLTIVEASRKTIRGIRGN